MPSIQVKDVPPEVHAVLRRRAAAAGRSLQEHLLELLTAEATTPTLDEVLARAGERSGGRAGFDDAVDAVRAERDRSVIVVDASVVVTALVDDDVDGERARARLLGETLTAPHLLDVEVVAAWRRLAAAGRIDGRRADLARRDLHDMRIARVPHGPLLDRCWELRANLTTYDATYVALAELTGSLLLTADRRLADAPGRRCEVEVLR